MPLNKPLIRIVDIGFAYNGNAVLEHISFDVERGDYVGVVGPNGGGKTTLLKLMVGLLAPLSGSVTIDGAPAGSKAAAAKIGYVSQRVSQDAAAFPATVYEIVRSGRTPRISLFGRLTENDKRSIDKAIRIADIENLRDKRIGDLSGGQRQRAYIARALASEPQILILDEPFVGVDIATQKDFYAFLKKLNDEEKLTILFVSHDVDMIAEEVKSVLCLNRGLLCFGKPDLLHEGGMIESMYDKKFIHLHHEH